MYILMYIHLKFECNNINSIYAEKTQPKKTTNKEMCKKLCKIALFPLTTIFTTINFAL